MGAATFPGNTVTQVQFGRLFTSRLVPLFVFALALAFQPARSLAADSATYECKSDLGAMIAGGLTAEVAQEDPDMAAALNTLTGHHVYSFDFANKRVTYRMLDNKGNDYPMLGIGQAIRYTTDMKVDGDLACWTNVISESPEGLMKADYVLNSKTGKMHVVTTIKPASGEAQTLDEDHTCIPYPSEKRSAK